MVNGTMHRLAALAFVALAAGCPSGPPPQTFTCTPFFFCGPGSVNGRGELAGCPDGIDTEGGDDECTQGDVAEVTAEDDHAAALATCNEAGQPDRQLFECVNPDGGAHVNARCAALCDVKE